MQEVARQSEGTYKLGPGTLYDNLQKLIRTETGAGTRPHGPATTILAGAITVSRSLGRGVLAAETARLADVVREARLRLQS